MLKPHEQFLKKYGEDRSLKFVRGKRNRFCELRGVHQGVAISITYITGLADPNDKKKVIHEGLFTKIRMEFPGGYTEGENAPKIAVRVLSDQTEESGDHAEERSDSVIRYQLKPAFTVHCANPRYKSLLPTDMDLILPESEWRNFLIDLRIKTQTPSYPASALLFHENMIQNANMMDRLLNLMFAIVRESTMSGIEADADSLKDAGMFSGRKPKRGRKWLFRFVFFLLLVGVVGGFLIYRDPNQAMLLYDRYVNPVVNMATGVVADIRLDANQSEAMREMEEVADALGEYFKMNQLYPNSLHALVPKYLKRIPKDPWGNAYIYKRLENHRYILRTLGAESVRGGLEADADISMNTGQFTEVP